MRLGKIGTRIKVAFSLKHRRSLQCFNNFIVIQLIHAQHKRIELKIGSRKGFKSFFPIIFFDEQSILFFAFALSVLRVFFVPVLQPYFQPGDALRFREHL